MTLEYDPNSQRADDSVSQGPNNVSETVIPMQDGRVVLPAGATLENLAADGDDLVITLADGTRIIIPGGAETAPEIVVEDVVIPPQTVAALLEDTRPEPAAGQQPSSGGNFADDEGEIQAAFDIGDLLPFTELAFPEDTEEEIIPFSDEEPEVVIETPDNPAGVENAIATVDEDGLPARGEEPEGTRSETDSEITSGTIVFDTPDGLSAILINGVVLTGEGQTFTSPLGTLTITSINLDTGEVGFTYVLEDNAVGEEVDGFFEVTVIDTDGDEAVATLSIIIVDDGPIAADDIGIVPAGSHDAITGDVLVNDEPGADDYSPDGAVQGFGNDSGTASPGESLQGEFGVLTLNADGTYSYVRDINTPGGVEDVFEYTIVDSDGSTSSAVLTIQIEDAPDTITEIPRTGDGTVVNEGALAPRGDEPAGSGEIADGIADNDSDPTEKTGSVIRFNSPDGLASVTLNGVVIDPDNLPQTIINDGTGILVVTGFDYDPVTGDGSITYDYTLLDNTSGDDTTVEVDIVVTDLDGDIADDTLVITIIDDVPTAEDDSETQDEENAPVTVDVLANDQPGADDVDPATVLLVDGTLSGTGTLVNNGDGTFTYTPGPGEEGDVTFDYTITDGDGDVSTATATITLRPDSEPELDIEGENIVTEAGLDGPPNGADVGSAAAGNGEFTGGTIAVNTGGDTVGSLVINGVDVTNGGTVTGAAGTLTVTGSPQAGYTYTYELTTNVTDVDQDVVPEVDEFSVVLTDSDGDVANDTITITIVDDTPTANADVDSVTEDGPLVADGNVLTGTGGTDANDSDGVADVAGADAASVTGVAFGTPTGDVDGNVGSGVAGTYGTLTILADGSYSYVLNNDNPVVQGLDSTESLTETFTYTITDGDGDTSTTTLTITINGADDGVTINGLDGDAPEETLFEDDLDDGSSPDSNALTQTGSFTVDSPDGLATLTVGGTAVFGAGVVYPVTIDDPVYGLLTITGVTPVTDADGDVVSITVDYSYTLQDNSLLHTGANDGSFTDSFEVVATDTDGSNDTASLDITIVDDTPEITANGEDAPTLVTDDTVVENNGSDSDTASFAGLFDGDFHADGPAATDALVYSLGITGGNGTDSGLDDTLTGENILLRVNGDAIEGYLETSGDIAFTLALDPATGDITQTQFRAIEHDDPNDPVESGDAAEGLASGLITLTATITDGDGDDDSATIDIGGSFTFEDDGPGFNSIVVGIPLDEDDLVPDGNGDTADGDDPSTSLRTFTYDVDFGADGPNADEITASFVSAVGTDPSIGEVPLASGGVPVIFDWNPATNTLTGYTTDINDPVLTMVFDLDASTMTLEFLKPLDHPSTDADGANDGPEIGYEDNLELNFQVVITDGDGDTRTFSLQLNIDDDSAVATDNSNNVDEGAMVGGNVLADDNAGADGFAADGAIIGIASVNDGTTQTTVDGSGNLVITTSLGTLTLNATTGVYSYESDANSTNADVADVFTYTIVDGDGDASTATLTINVANAPGIVTDNDVMVDEAGLDNGSNPGADSEIDSDGQISVVGATGTLVFSLDGAVAGPGADEVQIDGVYGTIVLNTVTGAYTYTLDTPFTDTVDENGRNVVNGAESFTYEVRDTNGNLIGTGSIDVAIVDDIPDATDQASVSVAEDAIGTIGGNVVTDGTPDTPGADGATVTAITIDGVETDVPQNGDTLTVNTAKGTYTIDMDGNWTFDPNPNQDHTAGDIDASFTYTLTDSDGDFDTAIQPILITDGAPPMAGDPILLELDDQNLADGSTPGDTSDDDSITFTAGSDDIASIVFGDTSMLDGGLTWLRVSDTQITGSDGGRLVVTLDLSVTNNVATVTATLNDNYDDHPGINVDDLVDLGDVNVIATDIDGDTATGVVSVTVSDDLPSISASAPAADALTVDETDLDTDASADFSGLFTSDANADGPGSVGGYTLGINAGSTGLVDTATNEAVVLTINNGVVEGRTATSDDLVFTVSVDASGTVTLDQLRAVKHADTNDDNDPATLDMANLITLSATITDSDGDTATATANIAGAITFLDDGPALSNVGLGSMVNVDETDGLTTSATSAASIITFTSDFGEDGDNGTTFSISVTDANSGLATSDGDFPITLVQTSATVITGTFNDGTGDKTAFTVEINADGTVTLTQVVALEHLDPLDANDTLNLAGKISATVEIKDGDGDTDSATIAIGSALTFFDDGPSVVLSGVNTGLSVSDADFGADDTMNFADNFTFNGGEDGTASTSFALEVTNGTDSGLVDTATSNSVFLFLESGVVVGREGTDAADAASGEIVFTVTTDDAGNVELDQSRAVDHFESIGSDGSSVTLQSDDLVRLIGTVTDNDGDQASIALNIGSNLTFTDDIPAAGANDTVLLDDDALGGNPDGTGDDPDAANLSGTLNHDFGNDGGLIAFDLTSTVPTGFQIISDGSNGVLIQQDQGSGFVTVVTVTLNPATGAYTVTQNANILHADGGDENNVSFTLDYIVTDGDGDQATSSLVINVDDDTPTAIDASSTGTVDEDGLSGGISDNGTDDAPGADTTTGGSVTGLFSAGADSPLTYALNPAAAGGLPALTSNGVTVDYVVTATTVTATAGGSPIFTFTLNADTGAWTFELEGPLDHATGDSENATDIVIDFGGLLVATDADGDSVAATGSVAVTVDDDSPRANDDTDVAIEGQTVTGNVLDGTGTTSGAAGIDEGGADGLEDPAVVAATSVNLGGADVPDLNGDIVLVGEFGTLTLNEDGSYSYAVAANSISADGVDVFTYTIIDNDGDTSTATLTFNVDNVDLTGNNPTVVVAEEALDTVVDPGDVAAGSVTGSAPSETTETANGQLTVTGATGFVLVGPSVVATPGFNTLVGTFGTIVLNTATGEFTYTLTSPVETTPNANDGAVTEFGESFTYAANDANGNVVTGTITVNVIDDVPSAAISAAGLSLSHDETPGIQGDADDVAGPLSVFAGVTNTGDDPDVAGTVIGFAQDLSGLVSTGTVFGADGAGTIEYTLDVSSAGVDSGLDTTDGTDILLYNEGGIIVGRVGGASGEAAFAIAVDASTGSVSLVQYLSILHPTGGTSSPDESVSIAANAITASVTVTDGDGDKDTATTSIGDLIAFQDDAGTLGAFTPGTQTIGNVANATAGGTFAYDTGADGHGTFNIVGPTLDGVVYQPIFHGLVDATDDGVDNANSQGSLLTATNADGSVTLFTIAVDVDGNFKYTLVTPDAGTTETVSLLGLTAGGPQPFVETPDFLIEFTGSGNGVNSSTQGFGIDNQFVGNGESFTIEFHSVGTPGDDAPLTNPDFVSSFVLKNDNINGSLEITVTVHNDADGTFEVIGPINVTGTETLIDPVTLDTFNRVEVVGTGGSGQGVRFTSLDFTKNILPNDLDLDFQVSAIDGDGDVTSTSTVNVMVDASIVTSTSSSQSLAQVSTSTMLLSDPIVGGNDGGMDGGSSGWSTMSLDGFGTMQTDYRSDYRIGEMSLVAAMSGAVLLDQTISLETGQMFASSDIASYEAIQMDWGMTTLATPVVGSFDTFSTADFIATSSPISAPIVDWSGLGSESALASSSEMMIGLQAEPFQIDLYQGGGSGFEGIDPSAFFNGPSLGVDQAMEALLMIEPGAEALADMAGTDPFGVALAEGANAVISDIAAEAAMDQLLDGLVESGDVSGYLMSDMSEFGMDLLDQIIETAAYSMEPMNSTDAELDQAAAAAASA